MFHTIEELSRHINDVRPDILISGEEIKAAPYGGDDDRIGWKDVHIITTEAGSIIGFTDGPLPKPVPR